MTDSQTVAKNTTSQTVTNSSFNANSGFLLFLKICQALCLALLIFCAIATYLIPAQYNRLIIYDAGLLAAVIFLSLLQGQFADFTKDVRVDLKNKAKARLYANLLPKKDTSEDSVDELVESRERALEYCQELIDDYKKIRKTSRNFYYTFQLATIILAGVTPILVVLDQQSTDMPSYLRWLPVIFPAIAAIVSSVSTSFPFETAWKDANRVVEQLEAEQEKFILGVTRPYRAFMIRVDNSEERRKKLKLTIENFIIEVNKIHLQQLGSADEKVSDEELTDTLPTLPSEKPIGSGEF